MLDLDEAIRYVEEVYKDMSDKAKFLKDPQNSIYDMGFRGDDCAECAEQHHQLAEWLKDYKRLLTQPQIADGDRVVSLNAVKDLYCRICMESNLCYRSKETCEDLRLFDKLPPVTPKTGHWISEGYYADGSNIQAFRCSECGNHILEYDTGVYNFCPVCGCRMKGVWSE